MTNQTGVRNDAIGNGFAGRRMRLPEQREPIAAGMRRDRVHCSAGNRLGR
jgi:hypothetical protein